MYVKIGNMWVANVWVSLGEINFTEKQEHAYSHDKGELDYVKEMFPNMVETYQKEVTMKKI